MNRANYYALAPDAMKAMGSVHHYVTEKSGLPKELVELVFLRVSQINGCAFCIDMHSRDLVNEGVPVDKLLLVPVWHEAAYLFSEREQAALKWAEVVTEIGEEHVPDEDYAAAAAVFEPKELVDLTVTIAIMNAYNRMGITFRMKPAAKA